MDKFLADNPPITPVSMAGEEEEAQLKMHVIADEICGATMLTASRQSSASVSVISVGGKAVPGMPENELNWQVLWLGDPEVLTLNCTSPMLSRYLNSPSPFAAKSA